MATEAPIAIRIATAEDSDTLHSLLHALAESLRQDEKLTACHEDLRRYGFSSAPTFRALLALRGEDALGMCIFFPTFSTWRGEPGIYVQDLYVADRARGQRLGRRLLAAAAAEGAREHGATHMRLAVDVNNEDAQAFYAAVGLRARSDEMTFQIDGAAYNLLKDDPQ
ncbi:MAG: GNAT family N-acetyltransferase [Pseudomonadota bacterium]